MLRHNYSRASDALLWRFCNLDASVRLRAPLLAIGCSAHSESGSRAAKSWLAQTSGLQALYGTASPSALDRLTGCDLCSRNGRAALIEDSHQPLMQCQPFSTASVAL